MTSVEVTKPSSEWADMTNGHVCYLNDLQQPTNDSNTEKTGANWENELPSDGKKLQKMQ